MKWKLRFGLGALTSVALIYLLKAPKDKGGSLHRVPDSTVFAEKIEAPSISTGISPQITFDDMMTGEWVKPSDSDLRNWIREKNGSEAAYLAAFGFRWSPEMNTWLASGLKAHPESLPMVISAANVELLSIYSGAGKSRKWLEKFRSLDPDNGLAWFALALAEFFEGEMERGSKYLIRASEQPTVRFYSIRFEEAGYEFGKANGHSESVSSLMGDASSPMFQIPQLNKTLKEVRNYSDILYESGFEKEAEEIAIAGYILGIRFFERDVADNSWAIYPSIGIGMKGIFEDQIPADVLLANEAVEREMERFREQWKSIRGKSPGGDSPNELEYLEWNYFRRNFGETEAAIAYSR